MKKPIIVLFAVSALMACSKGGSQASSGNAKTEGGVDVGNMQSSSVPQTYASIDYPNNWWSATKSNTLLIQNKEGSSIAARKSEITDISSPTPVALQQYLKVKYPDRVYKIIHINGLDGVRSDIVSTSLETQSDIYLVSELKDFIHIESHLSQKADGIRNGEKIILTVRVPYKGIQYPNAKTKTITLLPYSSGSDTKIAYSFLDDCYNGDARGVLIEYAESNPITLKIGTAGYAHGRIIELGSDIDVPFDEIRVEGKDLVAPLSRVSISDIYTEFSPKSPEQEQDVIHLKEGYVYLVRTINWPEEDLVTKMRIDRVNSDKSLTITYEKLAFVEPKDLQKQVDIINKYTTENEQPLSTGEVTLYNRADWNNYFYASFNFQYSTSGNMFITYNSWDLKFEGDSFDVPHTGSGIGQVNDLGQKNLGTISLTDFPDPNTFLKVGSDDRIRVVKGHTYTVTHYDFDEVGNAIFGAVQVLDLDPQGKWVHLKFRRMEVKPADHFQKWIELAIPQVTHSISLEKDSSDVKSVFYPFIDKRGDQGTHYYERVSFMNSIDDDELRVDSRPFGNERGFYRLGKDLPIENVSQSQIEALRGKFTDTAVVEIGAVFAVRLENFYDKTLMVIKIEKYVPGKSVRFAVKYLERAKTAYSDDVD